MNMPSNDGPPSATLYASTGDPITLTPEQVKAVFEATGFRPAPNGVSWMDARGMPCGQGEVIKAVKKLGLAK